MTHSLYTQVCADCTLHLSNTTKHPSCNPHPLRRDTSLASVHVCSPIIFYLTYHIIAHCNLCSLRTQLMKSYNFAGQTTPWIKYCGRCLYKHPSESYKHLRTEPEDSQYCMTVLSQQFGPAIINSCNLEF